MREATVIFLLIVLAVILAISALLAQEPADPLPAGGMEEAEGSLPITQPLLIEPAWPMDPDAFAAWEEAGYRWERGRIRAQAEAAVTGTPTPVLEEGD